MRALNFRASLVRGNGANVTTPDGGMRHTAAAPPHPLTPAKLEGRERSCGWLSLGPLSPFVIWPSNST